MFGNRESRRKPALTLLLGSEIWLLEIDARSSGSCQIASRWGILVESLETHSKLRVYGRTILCLEVDQMVLAGQVGCYVGEVVVFVL